MDKDTLKRRNKRRFIRKLPRLKGTRLAFMIPNMITLMATMFGLTSVYFALQNQYNYAVLVILFAGILDALDGRMARLLDASSKFGAELDSLSDFAVFGVAPGILMYFWTLQDITNIGWGCVLLYACCGALRLARFNVTTDKKPHYAYNYFQGVPAPAGAALVLAPMFISLAFPDFKLPVYVSALWVLTIGILMISPLPTYSLKKIRIPDGFAPLVYGAVILIGVGLFVFPWLTFMVIVVMYLVSMPFAYSSYQRLRHEAENIRKADQLKSEADIIQMDEKKQKDENK